MPRGSPPCSVPQSIHDTVYSQCVDRCLREREELVETLEGVSLAFDPWPGDGPEAKRHLDDEAGQAQAADRGAKPLRLDAGPQTIRLPSVRNSVSDSTCSPKQPLR